MLKFPAFFAFFVVQPQTIYPASILQMCPSFQPVYQLLIHVKESHSSGRRKKVLEVMKRRQRQLQVRKGASRRRDLGWTFIETEQVQVPGCLWYGPTDTSTTLIHQNVSILYLPYWSWCQFFHLGKVLKPKSRWIVSMNPITWVCGILQYLF